MSVLLHILLQQNCELDFMCVTLKYSNLSESDANLGNRLRPTLTGMSPKTQHYTLMKIQLLNTYPGCRTNGCPIDWDI